MQIQAQKNRFETKRLTVQHWAATRHAICDELAEIITPETTKYLPPDLHFAADSNSIANWADVLADQAEVLLIRHLDSGALSGLVILNFEKTKADLPEIYLGYLLAKPDWGKGLGSELVNGLVRHFQTGPSVNLFAGVEKDNPASARILEKAGFARLPTEPDAGHDFFALQIG